MSILIDLSMLRHPWCGLGQVALNYGRWYGAHTAGLTPGHEVTLLVPRGFAGHFGAHVHYLEAHDCYRAMPWLMPRFDLWHSIHQLSPFRPSVRSTLRLLTVHDVNFMYEKPEAKRRRYLRRLQHECDRSALVCFISRFAMEDALRYLHVDAPMQVVYNGVEQLTEGVQRMPQGVDAGRPFLLSLGVLKAKKNVHTLLPMMKCLPQYDLLIAGDDSDPYADRIRREAGCCGNVRVLGPVDEAGRRWLYAHCQALLFPSLYEGFGLPVVEAMQWGKPVFCSRQTALPEIGGDAACYFDSFEPRHMASQVLRTLREHTPGRSRELQSYAARFSYDRHMTQYQELYRRLLDGGVGGSLS
ncbi:MAG: Protein rfbU [bacterium P3]|nr:MAG: Protein rfbU [bacterium P3]KWW42655.1 MAG: Protein rfbU [bacterium F083]